MKLWHGRYRGTVMAPGAPTEPAGALMVNVPQVMGPTGVQLALPCFPYAGPASGVYHVPPPKASVWVEFEGGNARKPIWVGGFFPTPLGPPLAKAAPPGVEATVLQTMLGNAISVVDVPGPTGGILLRSATGAMIMVNDTGITLQDGKGGMLTMIGGVVSINKTNLVVLP
jgi:hypothetical protein